MLSADAVHCTVSFSLRYVILEFYYPFDLMGFVGYRTQGRGLGACFFSLSVYYYMPSCYIVRLYWRLMLFRMTDN